MTNRNNKLALAFMLVVSGIVACTKDLDTTDENNPTVNSYFGTATELQNGVNAAYSSLRAGNLVGREWFFTHDMRGSECAAGGAQLESPRAELLNQATASPANSVMTSVWNGCYQMINRANLVISKGPDVTDNVPLRDRVVAEAKFLRAWAYYELVSQWGEVPIYTEPITTADGFKPISPVADVYALIVSDLTDAATVLPPDYSAGDNGRATSGAANALLGRAQMQNGDYTAAKTALLKVYGKYILVDDYNWNFDGDVRTSAGVITSGHEFNAESIFEIAFVDKGDDNFNWGYTGEGSTQPVSIMRSQEYGITWGNVIPSDNLLNEYENGDPRYKYTFYEVGDQILTYPGLTPVTLVPADMNIATSTKGGVTMKRFFRKYSIYQWVNSGFHPDGLNNRMIRYAEVLLMLAECEAEVGTPAQAAAYVNEVRARKSVNMPPVTCATKDEAIGAVMHEKAVELGAEEINSIDMLRWRAKGYYPSVRPDPKPGQNPLLPIPSSETSTNPLIN